MDMQFFENGAQIPRPKGEIKIESLKCQPYPDRYRVFIEIKVTPFQERPNLILAARNADGRIIGELNIIETMHANMEFTMHIRNVADSAGEYSLVAELFYESKNPPQDQHQINFSIPTVDE